MSRVMSAQEVRRSMVARGWSSSDLAREAEVGFATVAKALDPDAALTPRSESKIVKAFGRHPVDPEAIAGLREAEGAA